MYSPHLVSHLFSSLKLNVFLSTQSSNARCNRLHQLCKEVNHSRWRVKTGSNIPAYRGNGTEKKDRKEKKCKMQKPIPRISKPKQQFMINSISPYPIMTAAGQSAFPHVGHDQPGSVYCCLCIKRLLIKLLHFNIFEKYKHTIKNEKYCYNEIFSIEVKVFSIPSGKQI